MSKTSRFIWPPGLPCCSAEDDVKKIKIEGVEVGLIGLDVVFEEVRKRGLVGDALREELFKKVRLYNWVAENKKDEYKAALFGAYKSFCEELDQR